MNPYFQRNTVTFTGGVEMDDYGAPIAYHVMRRHPGSIDRAQMLIWDKYPAFGTKTKRRNVIHLFDKTRPGQTRGVPYLTPVIETIKQLDRYHRGGAYAFFLETALDRGRTGFSTAGCTGFIHVDCFLHRHRVFFCSVTIWLSGEHHKTHPSLRGHSFLA